MGALFDRNVEVVLGTSGYLQARRFTAHRIEFQLDHQHRGKPNSGEISIWNLSRPQRAWLKENAEVCTFKAGYAGRLVDCFAGEVDRIEVDYRLPDIVTKFTLGDGIETTLTQRVERTFSAGTTLRYALEDVARAVGLNIAYLDTAALALTDQFLTARTITGRATDALEDLSQRAGLEWMIQDGQLYLISPLGTRPEEVRIISAATGLVGSPELRVKKKKSRERIVGVRFKSLLIPELRPGQAVRLESREFQANYKAERVIHQGDSGWSHGYYTTVEASEL